MLKIKLIHNTYNLGYENFKIQGLIRLIEKKFKIKLNYKNENCKLSKVSSQKLRRPRLLSEIKYKPKIKINKFLVEKIKNET